MFQGDEVAAVAADTEEQAIDAARLVKVDYEKLPHLVNVAAALTGQAPPVFTTGNVRQGQTQESGDLAAGFAAAAHTLEQTYETHVITHVCLESHGTVCEWEGDKLTVWISTQGINTARENFATALSIPQANIRVICQYMGRLRQQGAEHRGGGPVVRKAGQGDRQAGQIDARSQGGAPGCRQPSLVGGAGQGRRVGRWPDHGLRRGVVGDRWRRGGGGVPAAVHLPDRQSPTHAQGRVHQHGPAAADACPWPSAGSFITEIMMDELADLARIDPVEFRIKNLPPEAPNAMWRTYLSEGAEAFGWSKRHQTGDPTAGPIKTGMGVAVCTWGGGGRGPAQTHCEIAADGSVIMRVGTQDIGTGTRTLVAVVAADTLGLQAAQVTPQIGDTLYGVSPLSGGSTTAASISPAIRVAAVKALDALKEKVAPVLGVEPATLVATGGRVHVQGDTAKGLTWADACKHIGPQAIAVDGDWQPGMSSVTTSGVQFAEVTVDVETGITRVTRVLAIQDCGLVVSRLTAESQVYGGIIGSLNFAMYEDRILDRNTGQMVNPNMEWYLLAGMSDMPQIEIRLKDQPERGVIGIGEPPTVPTAAAIALAVRNACGVTLRSLPLTPARVLNAMRQQRQATARA